uniref:Uncharacterized protein n=1 Tax=Corvus moneduloides TaxID=1196302 RepID=A0A8C3D6N0_CORMO
IVITKILITSGNTITSSKILSCQAHTRLLSTVLCSAEKRDISPLYLSSFRILLFHPHRLCFNPNILCLH